MLHHSDEDGLYYEDDETYYSDEELAMLKAEADQMEEDALMDGSFQEDEDRHSRDQELDDADWENDVEHDGDDDG